VGLAGGEGGGGQAEGEGGGVGRWGRGLFWGGDDKA